MQTVETIFWFQTGQKLKPTLIKTGSPSSFKSILTVLFCSKFEPISKIVINQPRNNDCFSNLQFLIVCQTLNENKEKKTC